MRPGGLSSLGRWSDPAAGGVQVTRGLGQAERCRCKDQSSPFIVQATFLHVTADTSRCDEFSWVTLRKKSQELELKDGRCFNHKVVLLSFLPPSLSLSVSLPARSSSNVVHEGVASRVPHQTRVHLHGKSHPGSVRGWSQ